MPNKESKFDHICVYDIDSLPGGNSFTNVPLQEIKDDWFDTPLIHRPSFALGVTAEGLHFKVYYRGPLHFNDLNSPYSVKFQSELWRRDVAEIFVGADTGTRYQEFNFSPSGAWWSAVFEKYRMLEAELEPHEQPHISSRTSAMTGEEMEWNLRVDIPRSLLKVDCSFSTLSRMSVCFILGDGTVFATTARYADSEPDFHRIHEIPCGLTVK